MSKLVISESGRVDNIDNVELAEEVLKCKNNSDHWGAVDLLLKAWSKSAPDEVDALQIQINDYKETLADPKFGQTKGGKQFERRFQLVFPRKLLQMIRTIYKPEELIMDKEFFAEFIKRYPFFKVANQN